jgi:hypothetical protein
MIDPAPHRPRRIYELAERGPRPWVAALVLGLAFLGAGAIALLGVLP